MFYLPDEGHVRILTSTYRSMRYTPHVPLDGTHNVGPPSTRVQVERARPPSGASPVFPAIYHRPMPAQGAAFFDLDRTLLAGASGEAFSAAMKSAGFTNRSLPG